MSRRAASDPGQLLSYLLGLAVLSVLIACESRSSVTVGGTDIDDLVGGSEEERGNVEEPEVVEDDGADVTLFTPPGDLLAVTGEATLDPRDLSPLAGRGVLFFDQASESIIFLRLDGSPILYTHRDELLAATEHGSVELGRLQEVDGGPFDGQTLCADAVSGLLLRIGAGGIPHVHATVDQIVAATGESDARAHLPRSMASDQIIAQDLVSHHVLSFGVRGDAEILVDASDLATAAGVPEDAAEISGWARGSHSGDQFASFGSTNTVVRIRPGGLVDRHVHPEVIQALFSSFEDPVIVGLVTNEEGTDDLYILVNDGRLGRGIAVASPEGAVRLFTNFNDSRKTIGTTDVFGFGFLTLGHNRFFYALNRIGAAVLTLDAGGAPTAASRPADLFHATGATRVNLGPGAPIDRVGLVVLEPESSSFVLFRQLGAGHLGRIRPRGPIVSD